MKREEKEQARVGAMMDNRDGTFTVYQCSSKERPEGHRRIVRKFIVPSKPRAIGLYNSINR